MLILTRKCYRKYTFVLNPLSGAVAKRAIVKDSKTSSNYLRTVNYGITGLCLGAVIGTTWYLYDFSRKGDDAIYNKKLLKFFSKPPEAKITRRVVNSGKTLGMDLILFQFQNCPFCSKVRAFLDFQGLSYSIVEVDAVLRHELNWSDHKKVPILLAKCKEGGYIRLLDSTAIISILAAHLLNPSRDLEEVAGDYPCVVIRNNRKDKFDIVNKYFVANPDDLSETVSPKVLMNEKLWRMWGDECLVHLISPNIYRTYNEALETFEWFAQAGEWKKHFPNWECTLMKYGGATMMWLISKRLATKYCPSGDVRFELFGALEKMASELKTSKSRFLGGIAPNLADISIYGILSSIEGCSAFQDCLENTKIGAWYYDVKVYICKASRKLHSSKPLHLFM